MGKPKTPEEERAAAARREAIMKAFSQSAAPKVAPRLSDVSTSSSTRSSNAIDQMLSGMDTGTTRKRDTSLAPWAGTEYVGTVKVLRCTLIDFLLNSDSDRDPDWMPGNMAAKKSGKLNKVFLSIEQQQVLGMVLNQGKNIFFTGSAGEFRQHNSCPRPPTMYCNT